MGGDLSVAYLALEKSEKVRVFRIWPACASNVAKTEFKNCFHNTPPPPLPLAIEIFGSEVGF